MSGPHNPPAFPCEAQGNRDVPPEHDYIQTGIYSAKFPGMSLRDWFATHAPEPHASWWAGRDPDCAGYAQWNYQYADAMLAARGVA